MQKFIKQGVKMGVTYQIGRNYHGRKLPLFLSPFLEIIIIVTFCVIKTLLYDIFITGNIITQNWA
jgi:hypothetical protein